MITMAEVKKLQAERNPELLKEKLEYAEWMIRKGVDEGRAYAVLQNLPAAIHLELAKILASNGFSTTSELSEDDGLCIFVHLKGYSKDEEND